MKEQMEEDTRLFEENLGEYYTQSYSGPEEAREEGTGKARKRLGHQGQDQEAHRGAQKEGKGKQRKGAGLCSTHGHEPGVQVLYRRRTHLAAVPSTKEKEWWDDDYVYEHEKGKGKDQYGKKGGHGKEKPNKETQEQEKQSGFVPRDEEDRQYWDRVGKIEEEKMQRRKQEKLMQEEEERPKKLARAGLKKAAEENSRKEAEKERKKKEEEERKRKRAAVAAAREAEDERKKKEAEAAAEEEALRKAAAAPPKQESQRSRKGWTSWQG